VKNETWQGEKGFNLRASYYPEKTLHCEKMTAKSKNQNTYSHKGGDCSLEKRGSRPRAIKRGEGDIFVGRKHHRFKSGSLVQLKKGESLSKGITYKPEKYFPEGCPSSRKKNKKRKKKRKRLCPKSVFGTR